MRSSIISLIVLVSLAGCANHVPPKTLAQLDANLSENQKAATRFYSNKTPEQIRQASHDVLYLLDPSDMKFDIQNQSLMATRFSTFYAVFSFGFGRDWYSVDMTAEKNGTNVRFATYGELLSGLPSPIPESYRSNIQISAHDNPADFKLFHDRLEYMLGTKPTWTTCEQAKNAQVDRDRKMALCDQLGLENKSPNDLPETRTIP